MKSSWQKLMVMAMLVFAANASAEKLGEINPKPGEINPKTGENWKLGDTVEGKITKMGEDKVNTICNQGQCSDLANQKQPGLMLGDQVNCQATGYECAGMSWNCTVIKP